MNAQFSDEVRFALEGRVALVTGAGGAIGGAIASLLHSAGCHVALADRDHASVRMAAADLAPPGGEALAVGYDAADGAAGEAVVAETIARFGRLDFLIPAAGIYPESPFVEIADDDWQRVIEVNLNAVFRICRAAAAVMNEGSSIVHISSIAGHRGSFHHAHYAASKGAILALSRSMARDLAPAIRVNAVSPGVIETAMTQDLVGKAGTALITDTPMGRFGTAADVAHAAVFLCTDAASFINGESLHVNGGLLMG